MNTSIAYNQLMDGNLTQAGATLYTGSLDFWWVYVLFVVSLFVLFIWTKEEAAVAVWGIMGSAALRYTLPSGLPVIGHSILYLIIVLSLALLLWRLFGKGE